MLIAQAQACLAVLPGSAAAAAERDAVSAVLRLRDFGVELPPLHFRQVLSCSVTSQICHVYTPSYLACSPFLMTAEAWPQSRQVIPWVCPASVSRINAVSSAPRTSGQPSPPPGMQAASSRTLPHEARTCLDTCICAQVADRMDVLQMALDARPGAHADASAVEQLAALLGLAGRGAEVGQPSCGGSPSSDVPMAHAELRVDTRLRDELCIKRRVCLLHWRVL